MTPPDCEHLVGSLEKPKTSKIRKGVKEILMSAETKGAKNRSPYTLKLQEIFSPEFGNFIILS